MLAGAVIAATSAAGWWFLLAEGTPESTSCSDTPDACAAACDSGSLVSCYRLGEAYYYTGPEQDHARALAAYTKACHLGRAGVFDTIEQPDPLGSSCFLAGAIWSGMHGHPPDLAKAWAFYAESCGHRFGHGCHALGEMYESGKGAPRDDVEAHRYYALGCGYGSDFGCTAANRIAP